MTDYPTRDELDEQYTWDLTRIYETPDDYEAAYEKLENRIGKLRDSQDPAGSPSRLAKSLEAIEAALVTKSRLTLYTELRKNEDATDEERRDRRQRMKRFAADVDEAVQALRRRVQRDAETVEQFRDNHALEGWVAYLDDLLARAPHTRGAGVESVLAAFEPVVSNQTDAVVAITTEDFDPPTVEGPDGDPFTVDWTTYREAMDSPDRPFRRRAHEAFYEDLAAHENALATVVAQKIRGYAALAEARNYDSVRAMAFSRPSYPDAGMHVDFPEGAHGALIERVRENLDPYHDLLESRQELLGVETLRPWDASGPMVDDDPPEMAYEDLQVHLLSAVEPLGEDYQDRLAAFLHERRVDVYPTENKRTDIPAYCPSNHETGAFILANFQEDVRTAFFLAHELGHAMHIEEMRDAQPPRYVSGPRPISEVPSLVHELLLADHLRETEPAMAAFVRERRAEFLAGNVYGAGLSAAFLHDAYCTVEDGADLTPDRLAEMYADYAAEFRGPMEPAEPGRGWQRQGYAREPYHYYQYVLGAAGAVSVFHRIQTGDMTTDGYRDFLRNTGCRDSLTSFEALGVDVTASDPYERVAVELHGIRDARLRLAG